MNFKQFLNKYQFFQILGCISHRIYTNTIYNIEVVNITATATVLRNGDIVATFNIHDQNISDQFIVT